MEVVVEADLFELGVLVFFDGGDARSCLARGSVEVGGAERMANSDIKENILAGYHRIDDFRGRREFEIWGD
jgi:hypothetical protein